MLQAFKELSPIVTVRNGKRNKYKNLAQTKLKRLQLGFSANKDALMAGGKDPLNST